MTTEEVGGRRFIQCENFACNRRILLDKPNRTVDQKLLASIEEAIRTQESDKIAGRRWFPADVEARSIDRGPDPTIPTRTPMAKRCGKLSPEQKARISAAMIASHARRRQAKGLPPVTKKPPIDITPQKDRPEAHVPLPAGKSLVVHTNGRGGGKTTAVTASIDKALEQLVHEEEALRAELDANQEKQGALRKAQAVLEEVGA